jgi:predicted RNase H-like nuclease
VKRFVIFNGGFSMDSIVLAADNLYQDVSSFIYSTENHMSFIKESGLSSVFLRLIKDAERYAEKRKEGIKQSQFNLEEYKKIREVVASSLSDS